MPGFDLSELLFGGILSDPASLLLGKSLCLRLLLGVGLFGACSVNFLRAAAEEAEGEGREKHCRAQLSHCAVRPHIG